MQREEKELDIPETVADSEEVIAQAEAVIAKTTPRLLNLQQQHPRTRSSTNPGCSCSISASRRHRGWR